MQKAVCARPSLFVSNSETHLKIRLWTMDKNSVFY